MYVDGSVCGNMVMGETCSENALCYLSEDDRYIENCSCTTGYIGSGFICRGALQLEDIK